MRERHSAIIGRHERSMARTKKSKVKDRNPGNMAI
jgi:hypothetical protein